MLETIYDMEECWSAFASSWRNVVVYRNSSVWRESEEEEEGQEDLNNEL